MTISLIYITFYNLYKSIISVSSYICISLLLTFLKQSHSIFPDTQCLLFSYLYSVHPIGPLFLIQMYTKKVQHRAAHVKTQEFADPVPHVQQIDLVTCLLSYKMPTEQETNVNGVAMASSVLKAPR